MPCRRFLLLFGGAVFVQALSIATATGDEVPAGSSDETFFETRIRPVLAGTCVECHGPDVASGGLRLDTRDRALQGGERGPALVPGDVDRSLLLQAIQHSKDQPVQMPPDDPLPAAVVADLEAWIAAGAKWPAITNAPLASEKSHWAFKPLKRVAAPDDPTGWASQPIDRWIAAARNEHGLRPNPPAGKRALVRRAFYDLIGLPPTPEQIKDFLTDQRPDAFARVVEQLLASPRYGERWGRYWLDLVRYADTAGDNSDYPIPQAHLYRDYVIDAFNADMPYDQFLHEQLAGDLLAVHAPPEDYQRLIIATGFIAQAKRMGTRELEDMHIIIEDTLATVGPALLGLSLRCARCHDHKFDPLTQKDYYAFYGFFASTQYPFPGAEEVRKQTHFAPLIPPDQVRKRQAKREQALAGLNEQIEQLEARIASVDDQQTKGEDVSLATEPAARGESDAAHQAAQLETLREELERLEATKPLAGVPTAYAVTELEPAEVRIHKAGNPRQLGEVVPRGVPGILDAEGLSIPEGSSGRLELARWLTTKAHFLTSRVMVNRIWQFHFGKPLVPTPSDYGFRGEPPTHPELLDWLAVEFIASGWSIHEMHRKIMLSKTYQLSSEMVPASAEQDTGNKWLWRFDRRRLDAEALRDTLLTLGGALDLSRPGPHPFPEPSTWRFTAHHQFNHASYPSNHRSVYLMVQRLHAHPYLSLFNGADPSISTAMRDNSTVPLQDLYLINNELIHEQSARFASHLLAEVPKPGARVRRAYLLSYARPPSAAERAQALEFIDGYEQALEREGVAAEHRAAEAWSALARALMASNELIHIE